MCIIKNRIKICDLQACRINAHPGKPKQDREKNKRKRYETPNLKAGRILNPVLVKQFCGFGIHKDKPNNRHYPNIVEQVRQISDSHCKNTRRHRRLNCPVIMRTGQFVQTCTHPAIPPITGIDKLPAVFTVKDDGINTNQTTGMAFGSGLKSILIFIL
ncbi:MAG: hypothetical protein LBR26_04845 [Prevotella sp.]|jgi:hypothetical protein|nr:hypothetical protein [Prevotella sp.]